jgi:hypothetical protein
MNEGNPVPEDVEMTVAMRDLGGMKDTSEL